MKLTLLKLKKELGDKVQLSNIAEDSGWDKSSLSIAINDEYDMNRTRIRRKRMKALIDSLRSLRTKLDRVIKFYEERLEK